MSIWEKLKAWLTRPVQVKVEVLDFQKAKRVNKKDLRKIVFEGVEIDSQERKILQIGNSKGVTHPEGWLYSLHGGRVILISEREGEPEHVDTHLILCEKPESGKN